MSSARVKLPDILENLLRSEMEACINEANLGNDDTLIAKRYLISQVPQIEIAAELGWTRSTVSNHVGRVLKKVENTANKLNIS